MINPNAQQEVEVTVLVDVEEGLGFEHQLLVRLLVLAGDGVLQLLALDEGHRDERLAVSLVDLVDRTDVRVVKSGGGFGLAQEALLHLLIAVVLPVEHLDRHGAMEGPVPGQEDITEPSRSDLPERLEGLRQGQREGLVVRDGSCSSEASSRRRRRAGFRCMSCWRRRPPSRSRANTRCWRWTGGTAIAQCWWTLT